MKKIIYIFIMLIPFLSFAQKSNSWKLFNKNKTIASGKIGTLQKTTITSCENHTLQVWQSKAHKNWNLNFIVMDSNRTTIDQVEVTSKSKILKLKKEYFFENEKPRKINIYISETPNDPKIAMLIKVAPQEILRIALANK